MYTHLIAIPDFVQPHSEIKLTGNEYASLCETQYMDSIDSVLSQEWFDNRPTTDTVMEVIDYIVAIILTDMINLFFLLFLRNFHWMLCIKI